ncbi:hypothetical protein UFOVP1336_41 [uncultured Caudovirales phage]|uniref:Holin n=1 Tax=uncultured Caudovirales phage TaxID=2100421 RepID=A0A6J5RU49_9CAUD|nr:hypothetical protein UFOVP1336_41 [uncultured Caudovirales phage]
MNTQIKVVIEEALRTATATALALWIGMGVDIWSLNTDSLKALSAAAIAAAVQVVLRYLQPGGSYGIGAVKK